MSVKLIREFVRQALLEQVRKKFHMDLPADLLELSQLFKAAGHQLYVVGGSVRDVLQGKEPKDYDVATDASPDRVIEFLGQDPSLKILPIGKAFGVVKVLTPEGGEYEIATFRRDMGKGRRPDSVEFTNIETDVQRRDLTINALFYDIDKEEIVDFVGGMADIENKVVRAVGDAAERFSEDPLRILRALRFAGRMGSQLDPAISQAIKNDNKLTGVSPPRIREEFLKGLVAAQSVAHFLDLVDEYDLWPQVFPGLNVSRVEFETKNVPVALARLLWANPPDLVAKRLNVLTYSADECKQVSFLLRFKGLAPENAFRLRKLYATSGLTDEDLSEFAAMKNTPDSQLVKAFLKYRHSITGEELMAQGFSGAALGKEQERLETERFKELL